MDERYTGSEQERLPELLRAADEILEDRAAIPGYAYEKITIPLSWLFNDRAEPKAIGYRRRKHFTQPHQEHTSLPLMVRNLQENGVMRYWGSNRFPLGGWYGAMDLTELRPAELRGRQVLPVGEDKLYKLHMNMYDGEGRSTFPIDSFTFSNSKGLLEYDGKSSDPINLAIDYLKKAKDELID